MSDLVTWDSYPHRVTAARMVTPVIRELWFAPTEGELPFTPGQYVLLGDVDWRVPQRSFSVANAPRDDGAVSILVTLVAGGATSMWAHGLSIDDEVLLEGPFGTFVTEPGRASPMLLLGAGSGLAPCRALAEAELAEKRGTEPKREVVLFFSGRTAEHVIDGDIFEAWQDSHPRFRYFLTLTREADDPDRRRPGARIPDRLADEFDDLTGWEVFAAGPSGFVTGCAAAARSLGAAAADIRTEEFFTDPTPWTDVAPSAPPRPARKDAP